MAKRAARSAAVILFMYAVTLAGGTGGSSAEPTAPLSAELTTGSSAPTATTQSIELGGVVDIAVGEYHSCALMSTTRLKCWGSNEHGQLGDGTTIDRSMPVDVAGLSGVTRIEAGGDETCALVAGGQLRCWGWDYYGQLGDGTTGPPGADDFYTSPKPVVGLANVTDFSVGYSHACAIVAGQAKCWGDNNEGALGDGTKTNRSTPVNVTGLTNALQISAGGAHSCAKVTGNTAKCWGFNNYGQLGDGTTTERLTPVAVTGIDGVLNISAARSHTCAVARYVTKHIGFCWGASDVGQSGSGFDQSTTPVAVQDGSPSALELTAIVADGLQGCGVLPDTTIKCWGANIDGTLGTADTHIYVPFASPVPSFSGVTKIVIGRFHQCALVSGAKVRCWGGNGFGQVGDLTSGNVRTSPTPVVYQVYARFFGVTPKRLLDSRDGTGGYSTPWNAGETRLLTVTGGATTVPSGAIAVVLNITAVGASQPTHVTLFPTGESMPVASNLNVPQGATRPNLSIVKVGSGGKVSLFNNAGTVNLLADVVGYFLADESGGLFTAITPKRVLDSRDGTGGPNAPWGPGEQRQVTVRGGATGVPIDATGVVVNMTITGPTTYSHLTVFPAGQTMPVASNLNFAPGETVPNLAAVKIGPGGQLSIFNNVVSVQVIADIVGYYTPLAGASYFPLSPRRVLDSRDGSVGSFNTPWGPAQSHGVFVASPVIPIPVDISSVVMNVTGIGPTTPTHVTVSPIFSPPPLASNLNLPAGDVRPNLVMAKIVSDTIPYRAVLMYNNAGYIHLVADVVGYYT